MAGCADPTAGRWRAGGELAQNAAMIPRTDAPTIALAAYSARSLAACARASGFRAIALDLFGDQDTLALADAWYAIGGDGLAIDADRLLAALHLLRARGVLGWVAGSGFEAHGELLQAASAVLPLIGNGAELVRHVRTPVTFFAVLAELGIAHPPSQTAPPARLSGWLLKDAHACGGWHIERLAQRAGAPVRPGPGLHYQRELRGEAYSALFLADGREACVLGIARLSGLANLHPFVAETHQGKDDRHQVLIAKPVRVLRKSMRESAGRAEVCRHFILHSRGMI